MPDAGGAGIDAAAAVLADTVLESAGVDGSRAIAGPAANAVSETNTLRPAKRTPSEVERVAVNLTLRRA